MQVFLRKFMRLCYHRIWVVGESAAWCLEALLILMQHMDIFVRTVRMQHMDIFVHTFLGML